jgi:hypothetical protein
MPSTAGRNGFQRWVAFVTRRDSTPTQHAAAGPNSRIAARSSAVVRLAVRVPEGNGTGDMAATRIMVAHRTKYEPESNAVPSPAMRSLRATSVTSAPTNTVQT